MKKAEQSPLKQMSAEQKLIVSRLHCKKLSLQTTLMNTAQQANQELQRIGAEIKKADDAFVAQVNAIAKELGVKAGELDLDTLDFKNPKANPGQAGQKGDSNV